MQGFYKCPRCGEVDLDQRRTSCTCGYKVVAPQQTPGDRSASPQRPRQLAYYSAILPVGAIAASVIGSIFLKRPDRSFRAEIATAIITLMAVLLLASILCGLLALTGIKRHGPKQILARAIVGILLSLSVLAWWAWTYFNRPHA